MFVSLHYRIGYFNLTTNASHVSGITAALNFANSGIVQSITDWFTYAQWSRTAASPITRTQETKAAVAPESTS